MKHHEHFYRVGLLVGAILLLLIGGRAMAAAAGERGVFNVKAFGAKGDGRTDDTDAIQAAVNAFTKDYAGRAVRAWRWGGLAGGVAFVAHGEVLFPAGTYRISRPIVFQRCAAVRGIGEAVVEQTDPAKMVFYFHDNRQSRVEGMGFKGGSTQLQFWTNNNGGATQITVKDCTFTRSGGYAVECLSFTKKRLTGEKWDQSKPWAPYEVTWADGRPTLTPNNAENLKYWNNSTVMTIAGCRFEDCMGAVASDCDTFVMRDSAVTVARQADGPIFTFPFGGESHLYNIKGVADPAEGKHPYWIAYGGILSVRDSDFQTRGERGIGFLRADTGTTTWEWFSIILQNCRVEAAGCPGNAIVWLHKGIHPPVFSMTGVTETSGRPVKAIAWEDPAALAHLIDFDTSLKIAPLATQYKIQLAGNSPNIDTHLPPEMESLRVEPIPTEALGKTRAAPLTWNYDDLEKGARAGAILNAADFGVDDDPSTDDTAAIQKLFDAAGQRGDCLILFPGRVYTLSDTVRLPGRLVVRGQGRAIFRQVTPGRALFQIAQAQRVGFKNLQWVGEDKGVVIQTNPAQAARIAFEGCRLSDQSVGIECLAGDGTPGQRNRTELLFAQGHLVARQGLITNAARAQLEDFWAINDPRLNEQAFIENRGGAMRVTAMLGNPKLWAGKRGKVPANVKDWPYSRNTRWFDNEGRLEVRDTRFGGESGGMCNAWNRAETGMVYIGGGLSKFNNSLTKQCILFLEKPPAAAVLENIASAPVRVDGVSWRILRAAGVPAGGNVFVSGVPAP